jgi:hypothetical protein
MLFSGKFISFPEKYDISGKFFGISRNFFSYLGKNVIYPEKNFRCFFIRKVPLKAWPPQLLEASYAPDLNRPKFKYLMFSVKLSPV